MSESRLRIQVRALSCALGVLAFITLAFAAEPPIALTAPGDCPSAVQLEAALVRRPLPAGAAGHSLAVRALDGGAELTLTSPGGESVLSRRIDSTDCQALADAAVLITEAYFVELGARAVAAQPAVAAPEASTTQPGAALADPPPLPPPPPTTLAPTPKLRTPKPPAVAEPGSAHVTLSLTAGADWFPGNAGALGELSLGLWFPSPALSFELHGATGSATTIGASPDRVRRWESRGGARVLPRLGSLPVMPWSGVGLAHSELELLDLVDPPVRGAWSPLLEAGLVLEQPLDGPWSLRAELGCRLLLQRERYLVVPDGQIGLGPRAACSLTAGVGWAADGGDRPRNRGEFAEQ